MKPRTDEKMETRDHITDKMQTTEGLQKWRAGRQERKQHLQSSRQKVPLPPMRLSASEGFGAGGADEDGGGGNGRGSNSTMEAGDAMPYVSPLLPVQLRKAHGT